MDSDKPLQDQIEDPLFRRAVALLDAGDEAGLLAWLQAHPGLVHQHARFEGRNYFQNPALLEFVAENPIRNGVLPANAVQLAIAILKAGARDDQAAIDSTLTLVSSGCVARKCGLQVPLIDLLCQYGADPEAALHPALVHGEFEAVHALLRCGANPDIVVAAALGEAARVDQLLPSADNSSRHKALAVAVQFGHVTVLRLLLESGENPNRYNPPGFHAHSTPLHQAALNGYEEAVHVLVEHGADLSVEDTLWNGTPAGWARHAGHLAIERYLHGAES